MIKREKKKEGVKKESVGMKRRNPCIALAAIACEKLNIGTHIKK